MKITITKKPQQFAEIDYDYSYDPTTEMVVEVEIGTIQERINSCNYTSLDKLFDRFLETGVFDLGSATSQGICHSSNKLDIITEMQERLDDMAINYGINEYDSYDTLMELLKEKISQKGGSVECVEKESVEEKVDVSLETPPAASTNEI